MPKTPIEQDINNSLIDIRGRLAEIQKTFIQSNKEVVITLRALITSLETGRAERMELEAQEFEQRANVRKQMAEKSGLNTTERISKEVTKQLSAGKVDWGEIWREKVLPALVTWGAVALATVTVGFIGWLILQYINSRP